MLIKSLCLLVKKGAEAPSPSPSVADRFDGSKGAAIKPIIELFQCFKLAFRLDYDVMEISFHLGNLWRAEGILRIKIKV